MISFAQSFTQAKSVDVSYFILPEFTMGLVLMKSGEKQNLLLNYNSLNEEMIYIDKGTKMAFSVETIAKVDTIIIKDKKFVVIDSKFFELIKNSKYDLYIEHKCKINAPKNKSAYGGTSESDAINSYSTVDMGSDSKLPAGYEVKPYLYYRIKKNGLFQEFLNIRQLEKIYSNKKALFNGYKENHVITFDNQKSINRFIEYMENH